MKINHEVEYLIDDLLTKCWYTSMYICLYSCINLYNSCRINGKCTINFTGKAY